MSLLTLPLETLLNQILALDPDLRPRLVALEGRVIALELTGLFTLYLRPEAGTLRVDDHSDRPPQVTIRGTPLALLRLSRGGPVGPDVAIDGDTHLARAFNELFRAMDVDWEEQLSRIMGDTAAHQAGNAVRGLLAWSRQALDTLGRDSGEYLQHESRLLPPRGSLLAFLDAVDRLREDADRLEARVRRLEDQLDRTRR